MCCKSISPFCGMSHHAAGYFLSHAKAFELCDLACLFWEFFPVTCASVVASLCLLTVFQVSGLNIKALSPLWVGLEETWRFLHIQCNDSRFVTSPLLCRGTFFLLPCFFRAFIPGLRACDGGLLCISWTVMRFLSFSMFVCAVLFVDLHMLSHPCIPGGKPAWSWWMIFCTGSWMWTTEFFFLLRIFNTCVL